MKTNEFEPYTGQQYSEQEILERSENFLKWADTRRSVRDFSSKPVPQQVMENIIMTASTAPSGGTQTTLDLLPNFE